MEFQKELDTKGLNCPLPLLRLKKVMPELQAGDVVKVLATDPAAHLDFGVFSERAGHEILAKEEADGVYIFYIRKGNGAGN